MLNFSACLNRAPYHKELRIVSIAPHIPNLRTGLICEVHGPPALSPEKEPPANGVTVSVVKQTTIKTLDESSLHSF